MQVKALELVPRCAHCYGGSPKAYYKREEIQPMAHIASEYQEVFRDLPWQPRRHSMKPEHKRASAEKSKYQSERKTTYGTDFICHPLPKKVAPTKHKPGKKGPTGGLADDSKFQVHYPKNAVVSRLKTPNVPNAKVIHPSNSEPFQGDTIYTDSYTLYGPSIMAASKPPIVKAKDNIDITATREVHKLMEQDDFIYHENVEVPAAARTKGIPERYNAPRCCAPMESSTEYNDFYTYTAAPRNPNLGKVTPVAKTEAISTTMADYTKPEGFEKSTQYQPPESTHYVTGKFDGTTTSGLAYTPFPVKAYELPIWAQKSTYKRPTGGMLLKSLYEHDYRDPEVVNRPIRTKPRPCHKNMIASDKGNKFAYESTYKYDFQLWENVQPRETYQIIEVYQPPKEIMICETNHRSHFTGAKAAKMKPCRHTSEHRQLNIDTGMTFATTYTETFRNPRPKSTPSIGTDAHKGDQQRATSVKRATSDSLYSPPPKTLNRIPTPYLSMAPAGKPESAANNAAVKRDQCQGQIDILEIDHTCQKCKSSTEECQCVEENT